MTGRASSKLVTPPKAGLDFAAVRVGREFLVVSADPITGAAERVGEYAVNMSANDVATSGNRPQFAEVVALLPEGSTPESVKETASQIHLSAKGLGISILGGHTEVTPGLKRPIVAVTAFSIVKRYITSGDARAGDTVMMTKTAGLEGTAILAAGGLHIEGVASRRIMARARGLLSKISIVEEAVKAFGTGHVHSMHDCTEGGVLGAVFEMSRASGVGFRIDEARVPVASETRWLCRRLSLDPLKLIGSGSLLLSVRPGEEEGVASALRAVCKVTNIGTFVRGEGTLVKRGGKRLRITKAPEDELWRVLRRAS
jgi:hydrogenase expression/formation protein HypE